MFFDSEFEKAQQFYKKALTVKHNKKEEISDEQFAVCWQTIEKIWKNRPGCMIRGCCKRTFAFHFYMEDDKGKKLSPGLIRAILNEGVKRGLLTQGVNSNNFKTFLLV